MDLYTRLQTQGNLGFNGNLPQSLQSTPIPPNTIHDTYSINGLPNNTKMIGINGVYNLPNPSKLDLGTLTPNLYLTNPPK